MPKFRKKPVIIEARLLNTASSTYVDNLVQWINVESGKSVAWRDASGIVIETLEGNHRASHGDWIIKGVKGEFYPCKPDIFEATYEKVED